MMTLSLFLVFAALFLLRVPVAFALGLSALLFLPQLNYHYESAVVEIFSAMNSVSLMAIPGFVFAGIIMARGGISRYLIEGLRAWVGHIPGGMAVVTILSCTIFAAISGSSPATAAAIGSIMIPGMVQAGYSKKYAMGLVAAAGTLGILIPPSIPLIIYGYVAETRATIGNLFLAGIIPGIFLSAILIITAIIYARRNNFGRLPAESWNQRLVKSVKALPGALMPVLILGSIYAGIATPTESAVMSVAYAIIVSLMYRELKLKDWRPLLRETVNITSMIFMIIAAAILFKQYLTLSQVPQEVAQWIIDSNFNKWIFFLMVNIMFFIMGTFLEAVAIILITLPVFLPVLPQLGIDIYHFAIIMTVNLEIAMITPPVGLNLFVVSGVAKEPLEKVIRAIVPFILIMLIELFIIIVWEGLSTFLIK
ncbi:MAG: TRAP transporter large permease [Bacillaceae bacterium]|nr:TRAP transporter large permease [Bacillaceae bacterium]